MEPTKQTSPSLDFEQEVNRAKWFMDDLKKGGWNQRYQAPGFDSWSKTIRDAEVPIKTLFMFNEMPITAEKFAEMMDPSNMELRIKWDDAFQDIQILEVTPDGGSIVFTRIELSCPLTDRSMVLYVSPAREVDWFGKRGFAMFVKNASHTSKAVGADGLVRATNGGNFYIAFPDDKEPEKKCQVFGLTSNNYNGSLPSVGIEWLVSNRASRVFYKLRENIIKGYNKWFNISDNNQ